jgi:hypothetical protein
MKRLWGKIPMIKFDFEVMLGFGSDFWSWEGNFWGYIRNSKRILVDTGECCRLQSIPNLFLVKFWSQQEKFIHSSQSLRLSGSQIRCCSTTSCASNSIETITKLLAWFNVLSFKYLAHFRWNLGGKRIPYRSKLFSIFIFRLTIRLKQSSTPHFSRLLYDASLNYKVLCYQICIMINNPVFCLISRSNSLQSFTCKNIHQRWIVCSRLVSIENQTTIKVSKYSINCTNIRGKRTAANESENTHSRKPASEKSFIGAGHCFFG